VTNTPRPTLHDAEDGEFIRDATPAEHETSLAADDGVFDLDERKVYVALDLDPYGFLADTEALSADEDGWTKDAVWFGDETHDYARSSAYVARYAKGNLRIDLAYYVVGEPGSFDVEVCSTIYHVDAEERTLDDDEINYDPVDCPAYSRYESALKVARNCARSDERFKFRTVGTTIAS
jgi:hypothetical protein